MIKDFLEAGQIVGTHGIKGELRVNPWCDAPDFLMQFKTLYFDVKGEKPIKVVSSRVHGNVALITLEGTDSVEKASALHNKVLYLKRSDAKLKENSYFIAELIGCRVVDADDDSISYGTISDVSYTGANDVWHITGKQSKEYLIPVIPQVVKSTDVANNIIRIKPLKGIFDDED